MCCGKQHGGFLCFLKTKVDSTFRLRINTITLGIVGQVCKTAPAEQRQENHKAVREGSRFGGPVLPMYVHRERGGRGTHVHAHALTWNRKSK